MCVPRRIEIKSREQRLAEGFLSVLVLVEECGAGFRRDDIGQLGHRPESRAACVMGNQLQDHNRLQRALVNGDSTRARLVSGRERRHAGRSPRGDWLKSCDDPPIRQIGSRRPLHVFQGWQATGGLMS